MQHEQAVLDAWSRHADDIGLLKGIFANQMLIDLTGDGDERDGVHIRVSDRGDEICRAWAGGRHAYADTS